MSVTPLYDEFHLHIEPARAGGFRVLAKGSKGDASCTFSLPFSSEELGQFAASVNSASRNGSSQARRIGAAKKLGAQLFKAVFQDDVRDIYVMALSEARQSQRGLRITLDLTLAPDLMPIPWEYLYDEPSFLATSAWTPVVRYLQLAKPRRPLRIQYPLRILAAVSSPIGMAPLDEGSERRVLEQALGSLIKAGTVELEWLDRATPRKLDRALRQRPFHIFHLIGHGLMGEDGVGTIVLERQNRKPHPVSGEQLGMILQDYDTLRLVLLNTCHSATTFSNNAYSSVASSLIQRQIPAVIGMQQPLTNHAAIIFSEEFYAILAEGKPVDAAMAGARRSLYAETRGLEWGIPVLFMRVDDGQIFEPLAEPAGAAKIQEATASTASNGTGKMTIDVAVQNGSPQKTASARLEMIEIPAGPFQSGFSRQQLATLSSHESSDVVYGPRRLLHEEHLDAFSISKYPVTNQQYAQFVQTTGATPPKHWQGPQPPKTLEDHPVAWLSWAAAQAFCQWLASETGLPFRLPTEGEWEKASRGTDGRIYPWGDEFLPDACHYGRRATVPVYAFSPQGDSPYGVADTVGNVREWTATRRLYGPNDQTHVHVVRGGGIQANSQKLWMLWCANYAELISPAPRASIGFRVALSSSSDSG